METIPMANLLTPLGEAQRWNLMVDAAKRAAEGAGYKLTRIPGRGLSNIWSFKKDGHAQIGCIRTTRDRWIAFPPLEGGKKWKTLDDVELVVVATVDSKESPENVEVYIFPAAEVRKRFNEAYAARAKAGHTNRDNFGMWVGLDVDRRSGASSVGSGIVTKFKRLAVYPIKDLIAEAAIQPAANDADVAGGETDGLEPQPRTIAEVMAWARERVATIAGVRIDAVKLDLKVEY
jgi:hypothetical protein